MKIDLSFETRIIPGNGLIEWLGWTYAKNRMLVQTQYLSRLKGICLFHFTNHSDTCTLRDQVRKGIKITSSHGIDLKIGEKKFLQQTGFMNTDFYMTSETMALNKSFRAKRRLIKLNNY